jgi:hypothetical protein
MVLVPRTKTINTNKPNIQISMKKETKLLTENIVQSSCEVENDIFFSKPPKQNHLLGGGGTGKVIFHLFLV